jgi:hypothetical protein
MTVDRVLSLARFAVRANFRMTTTRAGIVAFAGITALGPVNGWKNGIGWVLDTDLLFYGYLVASLFVIRSGLEQQRQTGLLLLLRRNLCSPVEHAAGAIVSLLGTWAVLNGFLFVFALLFGGSPADAIWRTWVNSLALATLLPFVLLVEAVAEVRIPMLLPILGYLAIAVVLSFTLGTTEMVSLLVVRVDPANPASSIGLLVRAAAVGVPGFGLFIAGTWLRASLPHWRGAVG